MTMEIRGKIKNIHFLIDTGSPKTYICEEVLNSYNLFIAGQDEPFPARLNKRQISVKVSPKDSNFNDLNFLGIDFLHTYRAQLFAGFDEKYFNI